MMEGVGKEGVAKLTPLPTWRRGAYSVIRTWRWRWWRVRRGLAERLGAEEGLGLGLELDLNALWRRRGRWELARLLWRRDLHVRS